MAQDTQGGLDSKPAHQPLQAQLLLHGLDPMSDAEWEAVGDSRPPQAPRALSTRPLPLLLHGAVL